jgi:hypothetical protein
MENGRYSMYDIHKLSKKDFNSPNFVNTAEDSLNASLEGTSETVSVHDRDQETGLSLSLVNMQRALNVYGHNVKNKTSQLQP